MAAELGTQFNLDKALLYGTLPLVFDAEDDYPEVWPILLHGGSEKQLVDGILCVPCEGFLRQLPAGVVGSIS